jgi:uncharacterized Tic20 family protein
MDVEATEVVASPEVVPAAQPDPEPAPYAMPAGQQTVEPAAQQMTAPPPPPPAQPPYGVAPGQDVVANPMKPSDERTTGMAAHLVALGATILSSGFLGFVCALVMYLVFRDRGPFVRAHAANALNIQIIAGIVMLVSLPLMLVLVGFLTFGAAVLWAVIMHIIGAVKANSGEWWDPPLTPQFVK